MVCTDYQQPCTLVIDTPERPEDIDERRAEARERAEEQLRQVRASGTLYFRRRWRGRWQAEAEA